MKRWMSVGFCSVGLVALAIASGGCTQGNIASPSSTSGTSMSRGDAEVNEASLLVSPMVQVLLTSEESMSGRLVNMTEMAVQVRVGGSDRELAWEDLQKIEPTGDIWAESGSTRMKIRGDSNSNGEPWVVPRQRLQFIDASGDIAPTIMVNLEGLPDFDSDRLSIIRDNNRRGYLVQEIRSLSEGQVEIVVQVAAPAS